MKIHEYQGKAILAPFGVPVPRGEMATTAAEAGAIARKLGGARQRRQGADPRRRPRQGRRRQGGEERRGGGEGRRADPRHAARHPPDRPGRARRSSRVLVEEGLADRPRALLRHADRSRHAAPGADGQLGRRHGHRGGRREDAAPDPSRSTSIPASACTGFQARKIAFGIGLEGAADRPGGQAAAGALRGVHRQRRLAHRDQPADRHRATATCSRSTRRSPSTTTRCSGTRTSRRCATPPKRIRSRSRRRSSR